MDEFPFKQCTGILIQLTTNKKRMNKKQFLPGSGWALAAVFVLLVSWKKKGDNDLQVPVEYYKLNNGLKVVLSPDKTAPTIAVGVYYNIGFRIEPKNRTGFAHLFEHMMFQGSKNLGKMEFIQLVQKNGGVLNGSTRFDFTNYFEVMPSHKLQTALWAEADRMKGLAVTQENLTNQQGVVKNEVKVNVLNQPYGGFPWLDMPQYANENWYNAHNFYGDLADLDSAKLEDVSSFFKTYYSPNNAVLVVVGDFETADAKKWITQYFAGVQPAQLPAKADIAEPKQEKEKRFVKEDKLANKPAIAIAYKMPEKHTPEFYAMGLIDQLMIQGDDSKMFQALVQEKGYTSSVNGGINYLGNMFDYNGPMLWMSDLVYDSTVKADDIIAQYDKAIADLEKNVTQADLNLAMIKMRSQLYDNIGGFYGIGKLNLLACFALFDDKPSLINGIEANFKKVNVDLIKKTIKEYLRPTNRTILIVDPKAPKE
jgi:predicted Zn-dependent peptidase